MAPRGRPPGRKNGASLGQQPTSTETTPAKKAVKKGKVGRPSKDSPKVKSSGPDTQATPVAASPITVPAPVPVPIPVVAAKPNAPISKADATKEQRNGTVARPREPSVVPEDSNITDSNSTVVISAETAETAETTETTEASLPTQPVSRPPGRPKLVNGSSGRGQRTDSSRHESSGYTAASVDLDAISYRQLTEDIEAYNVDLDFCDSQLAQDNLTPQEARTLQLRRLDLSHQIRFSRHRKETLEVQRALKGGRPLHRTLPATPRVPEGGPVKTAGKRKRMSSPSADGQNGNSVAARNKRARALSEVSIQDTISIHSSNTDSPNNGNEQADITAQDLVSDADVMYGNANGANNSLFGKSEDEEFGAHVQRLGFWKCRLCVSEKYLYAGPDRLPNAPSKWPLKDMGKLMSHYFDLHPEHEPEERCVELGYALDHNRGPFEHWLRKSRQQKIPDRSIIDGTITELQAGRVPQLLRDLCRAAAAFPGA